jgi:chemotaxis protein methyltransferase CheR
LEAITLLARSYANKGELKEAVRCCDLALELDNLQIILHFLRFNILQEQGEMDAAGDCLKKVLYIDPDFVMAHYSMCIMSYRQGRKKEAEKHQKIVEELLSRYGRDEVMAGSDGMTAGRIMDSLQSRSRV